MTGSLLDALVSAGEDFEWYPTTRRMVEAVGRHIGEGKDFTSLMDIGAGDGRVLKWLAEGREHMALYSIEKSALLRQQQPSEIIPLGTEFIEQDLMSLPVGVIFCNPPYSEFEDWAYRIISTAHADRLYLVLPQRWEDSAAIKAALTAREATARIIHRDDFLDAERRARAVVHVIHVQLTAEYRGWREKRSDPFDVWFDEHIDTFDRQAEASEEASEERALARIRSLDGVLEMVEAYQEDFARMEQNYRAIFKLDAALLKELGVDKASVRDGLKKRMQGIKGLYWQQLFERLDVLTARLTTKTRKRFLERLTGQQGIAFTAANAYAIALWAIKAANQYFDEQVVDVYRALSTHEGASNYKSNQKTWNKDGWRYNAEQHSHYALDYRIVMHHWNGIFDADFGGWEYPGGLHNSCHDIIADLVAVFGNLGFRSESSTASRSRRWVSGSWQDWRDTSGEIVFQVKAFKNGNLHFRVNQQAMKALNIEAGRLLGWLRTPADVVSEMGYAPEDAAKYFGTNLRLGQAAVPMLPSGGAEMAGCD